jgi:homoserine O-acetyltransferase
MFPGVLDTSRYCVVGTNILGSCYGSTGPGSTNPATEQTYGSDFPLVTVRDIVRAQARVLDELGIGHLHTVIGGSIGGMQALQWAVDFPNRVERCIAIGAAPLGAMGLALNHLQRQAIQLDPAWRRGRYDAGTPPKAGLALARAIAMCSYKSAGLLATRFGRRPNRNGEDPYRSVGDRFDVGGYLDHQGEKFNDRFDANSYLAITRTMDSFDLARGYASEREALRRIRARVLLVGISSDWLFPPEDVRDLAQRIRATGRPCDYAELKSDHGHDGFLADADQLNPFVTAALWRPPLSLLPTPTLLRTGQVQQKSWKEA